MVVRCYRNELKGQEIVKGLVKEKSWTDLKQDGKSHPANISKRAFGDSWPGFPLNLASTGPNF